MARQCCHELVGARALEFGPRTFLPEGIELVGRRAGLGRHDKGRHDVPPAFVRHADNPDVPNLGMPQQELLYLLREDVLAVGDHIVHRAPDLDIATGKQDGGVAGPIPFILELFACCIRASKILHKRSVVLVDRRDQLTIDSRRQPIVDDPPIRTSRMSL
jgi:hypothetical protein